MGFAKFSSSCPLSRSRLITKLSRRPSPFFARIRKSLIRGAELLGLPLCFVAIVRVRVYYVDFFVFLVLRHW